MSVRIFSSWEALDSLELKVVKRFAAFVRFRSVMRVTKFVNRLGDGWGYLPIAALVVALAESWHSARRILGQALLAVALAHVLHVMLKRTLARLRPFEYDPELTPLARVLDRYSFPSGHCMTMTCVAIPIIGVAPRLWPWAVAITLVLASCRLIAAHHYPSDVLAGISLGLLVATPISSFATFH